MLYTVVIQFSRTSSLILFILRAPIVFPVETVGLLKTFNRYSVHLLSVPVPAIPIRFPAFLLLSFVVLTGTDVEPVGVVGGELLLGAGLDDVNPGGDVELARTLKVAGVGLDEVLRADVANTGHC